MSAAVTTGRIRGIAVPIFRSGLARTVARTAGFNMASVAVAGIGGIILARALGPTVRGEYAAVISWFGVTMIVGGVGQPAALCFYVARDPNQAPQYVATSRAMMLITGGITLIAGMLLAPVLARGNTHLAAAYRIAFGVTIVAHVAASYTFSLQARDIKKWNFVRISQPVLSFTVILVLWRLQLLSLSAAVDVLFLSVTLQLAWAYIWCRRTGLAPGRARMDLVRPLAIYGAAQIAALTPATLNAQLDQLVLSQVVAPADLGRYAIAVSLSLLPIPLAAAVGNVAFPRLAARRDAAGATHRIQRIAILGTAACTTSILLPLCIFAHWAVPMTFGPAYRSSVPILWMLAPGAVFLACGGVAGDLLRGRNHPLVVAWSQGLAAVFTVVLLLALLPFAGIAGAAIASTVAYGVAFAVMLWRLWNLPSSDSRGPSLPTVATAIAVAVAADRLIPVRRRKSL